jgi:hypothetical protein
LPLITSRIEFLPSKAAGGDSVITPRIDFGEVWGLQTDDTNTALDPMHMELDKNLEDEESSVVPDDGEITIGNLNNSKIPKPQGEPGRPNCGGYNIENELHGWAPDLLENVTVSQVAWTYFILLNTFQRFVKSKANEMLDTRQSYKKQKPADITAICVLVSVQLYLISCHELIYPGG